LRACPSINAENFQRKQEAKEELKEKRAEYLAEKQEKFALLMNLKSQELKSYLGDSIIRKILQYAIPPFGEDRLARSLGEPRRNLESDMAREATGTESTFDWSRVQLPPFPLRGRELQ
jgi:hypothetical protein